MAFLVQWTHRRYVRHDNVLTHRVSNRIWHKISHKIEATVPAHSATVQPSGQPHWKRHCYILQSSLPLSLTTLKILYLTTLQMEQMFYLLNRVSKSRTLFLLGFFETKSRINIFGQFFFAKKEKLEEKRKKKNPKKTQNPRSTSVLFKKYMGSTPVLFTFREAQLCFTPKDKYASL